MKRIMKIDFFCKPTVFLCVMFWGMLCLTSCSKSEYVNAIPQGSTAVMALDARKMDQEQAEQTLKTILNVNGNLADCGIGFKEKLFVFETIDGNFGMCARVDDASDLHDFINKMSKTGYCTEVKKQSGTSFSDIGGSWALGFSDDALLIIGPVTAASLSETHRSIAKYLKQDEDMGIKASPLYAKLDSMDGAVSVVAQLQALPDKFSAPLSIEVPKGTDPSTVYVAADISKDNGVVVVKGQTFSFNKSVESQIEKARSSFRKINGASLNIMSADMLMGFFCNVDGKQFLPMLQSNPSCQALLAGVNTALDMDQIIRSVNGSFALVCTGMFGQEVDGVVMKAKLADSKWLADVGYWKQSCPQGGRIDDVGVNAYHYSNGSSSFFFGVSSNLEFYGGVNKAQALGVLTAKPDAMAKKVGSVVDGCRMAMVVNVGAAMTKSVDSQNMTNTIMPWLKGVKSIVYIVE